MTRRLKPLVLVPAGLAVLALGSLVIIGAVGRGRGVSRVPLPAPSLIAPFETDADYADSYAAPVSPTLFPDSRALDRYAFQRSAVAGERPDEILYRGESPSLVYHLSYLVRGEGADARLFVSTTVHYKTWRGRLYFAVVRPAHRQLAPFTVSVMIRRARAAGSRG